MNELISAEQFATAYALNRAGRLNKTFTLPAVNAFTIGQLLYVLEVETAYLGELYNINAFDQPGVEEGKMLLMRCWASRATMKNARKWTVHRSPLQNTFCKTKKAPSQGLFLYNENAKKSF